MVHVMLHENTHHGQDYEQNTILRRLYEINKRAYITGQEAGLDHQDYQIQPLELGAHVAGYTAEALLKRHAEAYQVAALRAANDYLPAQFMRLAA
jgi:hypothetical protein